MLMNKTYAVVGGDLRYAHLASLLAEKEAESKIYGMFFDEDVKLSGRIHKSNEIQLVLPQSDVVIFPLPMLDADGYINTPLSKAHASLKDCMDYISPDAIICAGRIPGYAIQDFHARDLCVTDYNLREEFAAMNAVPTAEGAIEIALRELPTTLFGTTCLITGYGRIGKVLTQLLIAFGAKVIVVARKQSDLTWAKIAGATAVHTSELGDCLSDADVLFNTVPAMLLSEDKLSKLKRRCLVIDLASKPGGVDFEVAKKLELKTIWALSLPGKVSPISAGEITLNTIWNILAERGFLS